MGQDQSSPAAPAIAPRTGRTPDEIEKLVDYEEPRLTKLRLEADAAAQSSTHTLSLARHGLSVLPPLPSTLTSLDLSYNRLVALPAEFAQLTALRDLRVSGNHLQLSGKLAPVLSSLQQLVHLGALHLQYFSWNFLDGAVCVPLLTRLTYLSLLHNRSVGRLPDLSPLQQLRYLSLAEVVPLQAMPAGIFKLSNLTELDMGSIQVDEKQLFDDAFAKMPNLRRLSLACGQWPRLPPSIGSCDQLEQLRLNSNLFTELPDSFTRLTRLVYLDVSLNKLPSFPALLVALTTLRELHMNGGDFAAMPDNIGALSLLQKFTLRFNAFAALPASVSQMTALDTLDLTSCKLATWPASFNVLTRLEVLNLINNPTVAADGVTALPLLRRYRGPMPLAALLLPAQPATQPAVLNNWVILPSTATTPLAGTTLSPAQLRDKIYGLIFGHALGDAIGLTTEFLSPPQAVFHCGLELNFAEMLRDRHRGRWIPGDWTDDTDQMLLILENLLANKGTPDPVAFGRSLLQWAHRGLPEFGDAGGMGIGDTVSAVLRHSMFWDDPQRAAREVWIQRNKNAAANGYNPIVIPVLGVPFFANLDTVLTNTDTVCQMLQGKTDVAEIIKASLVHAAKLTEDPAELLKFGNALTLEEMELGDRPSIGYTYKCFGSGFWALRQRNFAAALVDITREAGDADTNGAVAGALLGCRLGFAALPQQWLDGLVHGEWLRQKAEQLCRLAGV